MAIEPTRRSTPRKSPKCSLCKGSNESIGSPSWRKRSSYPLRRSAASGVRSGSAPGEQYGCIFEVFVDRSGARAYFFVGSAPVAQPWNSEDVAIERALSRNPQGFESDTWRQTASIRRESQTAQ